MLKQNLRYVLSAILLIGVIVAVAVAVPRLAKHQQIKAKQDSPWAIPKTAPALHDATPEALARAYPGDSRAILEAGEMTLFSVSPGYAEFEEAKTGKKVASFHQRLIMGKTVLTEQEKRLVLASLDDELSPRPEQRFMVSMQCFDPRHGVRAVDKTTRKRVDLLICFSCHHAYLYRGKVESPEDKDAEETFTAFGPAANYYMNDLLRKHDLPIAP